MGWTHQNILGMWQSGRYVTLGEDADGDIGVVDDKGYSIIIAAHEAAKLRKWVNDFIERRGGDA